LIVSLIIYLKSYVVKLNSSYRRINENGTNRTATCWCINWLLPQLNW